MNSSPTTEIAQLMFGPNSGSEDFAVGDFSEISMTANPENGESRGGDDDKAFMGAACTGMCVSCPFAANCLSSKTANQSNPPEEISQAGENDLFSLLARKEQTGTRQNQLISEMVTVVTGDSYTSDPDLRNNGDGGEWKSLFDQSVEKKPSAKKTEPKLKPADTTTTTTKPEKSSELVTKPETEITDNTISEGQPILENKPTSGIAPIDGIVSRPKIVTKDEPVAEKSRPKSDENQTPAKEMVEKSKAKKPEAKELKTKKFKPKEPEPNVKTPEPTKDLNKETEIEKPPIEQGQKQPMKKETMIEKSEPLETEPAEPESPEPKLLKPKENQQTTAEQLLQEYIKPETTKPEPIEIEPEEPKPIETGPAEPKIEKQETPESEITRLKPTLPKPVEPESTGLTEAEIIQPEQTEPESLEPENIKTEPIEPELQEPKLTQIDLQEPGQAEIEANTTNTLESRPTEPTNTEIIEENLVTQTSQPQLTEQIDFSIVEVETKPSLNLKSIEPDENLSLEMTNKIFATADELEPDPQVEPPSEIESNDEINNWQTLQILEEQNEIIIYPNRGQVGSEYTMILQREISSTDKAVTKSKTVVTKKAASFATRRAVMTKRIVNYRELVIILGRKVTQTLSGGIVTT